MSKFILIYLLIFLFKNIELVKSEVSKKDFDGVVDFDENGNFVNVKGKSLKGLML